MAGMSRPAPIVRLALALSLILVAAGGLSAPPTAAASLPRWHGGIDLYRAGVFSTQRTWLWCTAADVQVMRNIVRGQADHARSSQQRYFDYMRARNRYTIPVKDGVDPAGWTAGLRRYVDARYRLTTSRTFDAALRSAVTNLRKTNLPVAITVSHGNHAWVLTGFTATADPAVTTRFTVTSVRVVGPLWGLQSRAFGYDMRPDTRLTPGQLKGFFTPWHYAGVRMAWEGRWVSVQPVPKAVARPTASPAPKVTVSPTPTATPDLVSSAPPAVGGAAEPSTSPGSVAVVAQTPPGGPPVTPSSTQASEAAIVVPPGSAQGVSQPAGAVETAPSPAPTGAAILLLCGLIVVLVTALAPNASAVRRRVRR
jgi:hypothetical protein